MFTVVRTTTSLSLDEHFIKHPAATFFVTVEGDGMTEYGINDDDTLIVDRSLNPVKNSIVIAVIAGELTARPFSSITEEGADVWGVSHKAMPNLTGSQNLSCGDIEGGDQGLRAMADIFVFTPLYKTRSHRQ